MVSVARHTSSWWKMEIIMSSLLACAKCACLTSKWQKGGRALSGSFFCLYQCRTLTRCEEADQRGLNASLCWPQMEVRRQTDWTGIYSLPNRKAIKTVFKSLPQSVLLLLLLSHYALLNQLCTCFQFCSNFPPSTQNVWMTPS